jgi:pimeloyl-ACP methyl ester carboxylesterase
VLGHSWGGMLGLEYTAAFPKVVRGYLHMDGLISQPLSQDAIFAAAGEWVKRDAKSESTEQQARGKRLAPYVDYGPKLPPGTQRLLSAMQFAMSLPELYYADLKQQAAYQTRIMAALKAYKIPESVLYASEPGMALAQNDSYATRDARSLFPKITVPTLILNGNQDGVIPPEHARIAAKSIRGARLELLDRCGHFPFVEQPEKTTRAILTFIGQRIGS